MALAVRRADFRRVDTLAAFILDNLPHSVLAKEACFLRAYAALRTGRNEQASHFADSALGRSPSL